MSADKRRRQSREQEAVFTTIVGGRPPGSGTRVGAIPRGVEVLLKKASVDPEFRQLLLEQRAQAARTIDLDLTDAERDMLASIPTEQLEQIIRHTKVEPEHRDVFLGSMGKLMVAAVIGIGVVSLMVPSLGHTADIPDDILQHLAAIQDANDPNDPNAAGPEVSPQQPHDYTPTPSDAISRGMRPD